MAIDPITAYVGKWTFWQSRIMRRGGFIVAPDRLDDAVEAICGRPPENCPELRTTPRPGEDWGERCDECRQWTNQKWALTMNGGRLRERLSCPHCKTNFVRQPEAI